MHAFFTSAIGEVWAQLLLAFLFFSGWFRYRGNFGYLGGLWLDLRWGSGLADSLLLKCILPLTPRLSHRHFLVASLVENRTVHPLLILLIDLLFTVSLFE